MVEHHHAVASLSSRWPPTAGYSCTAYSTDRSCIVFVEAKCAGSHDKVLHQQFSIAATTVAWSALSGATVSCSLGLSRQQRTSRTCSNVFVVVCIARPLSPGMGVKSSGYTRLVHAVPYHWFISTSILGDFGHVQALLTLYCQNAPTLPFTESSLITFLVRRGYRPCRFRYLEPER